MSRFGILSDIHFPYQDLRAWLLTLRIIPTLNLDGIILLGDIIDFEPISKFVTHPRKRLELDNQITATRKNGLEKLRAAFTTGRIEYCAGNHECLISGTEVLTRQGFLDFSQISLGDEIATVNERGVLSWEYPTAIYKYPYDYDILTLDYQTVKASMTPNHRVWNSVADNEQKWDFTLAEKLGKIRRIYKIAVESALSDFPISDDWLLLLGWFFTDAYLSKDRKIIFYQSKATGIQKLREIFSSLSFSYREKIRDRNINQIAGKELKNKPLANYEFEIERGDCARILQIAPDRKNLPTWLWELSDRQVKIFLDALLDGNGSRRKDTGTRMLYGQSGILDQIQSLLVTHGIACSKSEYFDHLRRSQWRLNITFRSVSSPDQCKTPPERKKYTGEVWCLSVPNEKFLIRFKGRVHVTGNSRMTKYLYTKAPELADLKALTVPKLLELDKSDLDIDWIPWGKGKRLGKLNLLHGDEIKVGSASPARSLYLKVSTNMLVGHHHVFDRFLHRQYNGEMHGVWVNGTLSTLQIEWMLFPQWQQGFSVVEYTKSGYFHVDQIIYMRRSGKLYAMVNGKLMVG